MKNISVFAVLVIIAGSLAVNNSAFCQESAKKRNYSFSVGAQFGFVHGQALELVYPARGETKGELLSELKWDMKYVFYYGAKFDFSRTDVMSAPGFFASVSFKAGIPADSGIMEDRDWMSKENSNLTHFSSHTNKTREFYWLDLALGTTIPIKTYFYVKPFVSGSWMHFSFTGRDGYFKYPNEEGMFSGNVIHYKQDWFLIALGISAGTKILSPFSFDLSFQISPFTYCAAKDDHIRRETIFMDFTGWGLFLEPEASVSFKVKQIEFFLNFNYRYIGRTIGQSYQNEKNTGFFIGNKAGAGLSLFSTNFLIKILI